MRETRKDLLRKVKAFEWLSSMLRVSIETGYFNPKLMTEERRYLNWYAVNEKTLLETVEKWIEDDKKRA